MVNEAYVPAMRLSIEKKPYIDRPQRIRLLFI